MSSNFFKIMILALAVYSAVAVEGEVYLYSHFGCVDTFRIDLDDFDWADYPNHDVAFFLVDSKNDSFSYLIRGLEKGVNFDGMLCSYRNDWKGFISGDSLRILLGRPDSIGMTVLAANMLFTETDDEDFPFRFYKPDMLALSSRLEFEYLSRIERSPVLVLSEKHYPSISWLGFDDESQEVRLEPLQFAHARTTYRAHHIKRFRLERNFPSKKKWSSENVWCEVPLLLDDKCNSFTAKKFGFLSREILLRPNEQGSLSLKRWLYLNPSPVLVWDTERSSGPWPSDIFLGVDVSGLILPGPHDRLAELGLDYELIVSPFPTALKAGLTWYYGDLWSSEAYYLLVYDSNPLRPAAHGMITEHELSGKALLGRKAWKYFPFRARFGYGTGRTFVHTVFRERFLTNEDSDHAEGHGFYISGGFELWFLRSALLRPAIEAGVAWGNGRILSNDGEILSESGSDDDRTFPFVRLNLK